MSEAFILQILCNKLLLVLNHVIKKIKIKSQLKKIVLEIVNFGSQILTKPKKKSRNTTKYHNIFTISFISSCGRFWSDILLFYFLHTQYFHNKF